MEVPDGWRRLHPKQPLDGPEPDGCRTPQHCGGGLKSTTGGSGARGHFSMERTTTRGGVPSAARPPSSWAASGVFKGWNELFVAQMRADHEGGHAPPQEPLFEGVQHHGPVRGARARRAEDYSRRVGGTVGPSAE